MRLTTSYEENGPGIFVLQDPNYTARGIPQNRPDRRACMLAVRVKNVQITGEGIGHYEYDQSDEKYQIGDMVGSLFWPGASRVTPGVSYAWPAMMGSGSGGPGNTQAGPGGGGAQMGAVFTDPPIGPDANSATYGYAPSGNTPGGDSYGSSGNGAGFTFTDPANQPDANSPAHGGFGHPPPGRPPGVNGESDNNPQGPAGPGGNAAPGGATPPGAPGADVATEGGHNTCGTMPSSLAKMLPIGTDWKADTRYKPLRANMPDIWPKFPKGTFGIALPASDETQQQELFFPISPNLMAINKAGDPMLGSLVCDANDKFEIDKDRVTRLQSMMWVLKKPKGGENAIGWNLNESGCGDVVGGWVVDKPNGGDASPSSTTNGAGDGSVATGGGGVVVGGGGQDVINPVGGGSSGPGQTQTAPTGKERVIGRMSVHHKGPIDVGSGKCSHADGEDADGNKISPCHITVKALFRRNDTEDGPIDFNGPYPHPEPLPYKVQAHLGWDPATKMWKFWAEQPFELPTVTFDPVSFTTPTNPTNPGVPTGFRTNPLIHNPPPPINVNPNTIYHPTSEGNPGGQGQTNPNGGGNFTNFSGDLPGVPNPDRPSVPAGGSSIPMTVQTTSPQTQAATLATPFILGATAFAAQAQDFTSGKPNNQNPNMANQSGPGAAQNNAIAGMMSAFSAQGGIVGTGYGYPNNYLPGAGDPRVYTHRPGESKFQGGTTSGGWVIHPPETGPEDAAGYGMVPPGITLSTTVMVTAPGAYFGAGIPQLTNGSIKDGYLWGMDATTGDLVWYAIYNSSPGVEAFRMMLSTGNFRWTSATGLVGGTNYYGEFEHGNTGNRIYTFPDQTGPVAIMLTGTGSPAGAVTARESTGYWDTAGNAYYINNDGATGWTSISGGGGGGAPTTAQYVTLALDAGLSAERVLTGTANQIIITDNGANSTVVLSTPQNIHTGATPTFAGLTISSFTQGSVIFAGVGGLLSQDNANLFFDDGNNRLGVGTATPRRRLDVLEATGAAQARLTYTDNTVYTDLLTSSIGDMTITPTGNIVSVQKTHVGADLQLTVYNVDNTNAASGAVVTSSVGGASAGDPWTLYIVQGVGGWSVGLDNSDSDKYKISRSFTGVGTNDWLTITTAGNVGINCTADTILETRRAVATYWGQTTPGTWNGSTAPSMALTITNSNVGGYDPLLLFRMATSTGTIKTAGAIDMTGQSSWTDGNVATQIADMLFIVRNSADTLFEGMRLRYDGKVGINNPLARRRLDVVDSSAPQIRATYTDNTVYTDFQTTSGGFMLISPTGFLMELIAPSAEFRVAGTATNQALGMTFYDNAATLKGRLFYAGSNGAGNRGFDLINDSSDYLAILSDVTRILSGPGTGVEWARWTGGLLGLATATPNVLCDVNGGFAHRASTATTLTADAVDYAFTGGTGSYSFQRVSSSGTVYLRGFAGGFDGKRMTIANVGTQTMIVTNQDSASAAANRVLTGTGQNVAIFQDQVLEFIYDATVSRWRAYQTAGSLTTAAFGLTSPNPPIISLNPFMDLNDGRVLLGTLGQIEVVDNGPGQGVQLSLSGSMGLLAAALPSFTVGSVIFMGSKGTLAEDNAQFFWDDTNNLLKLGTSMSIGADPATVGTLRVNSSFSMYARSVVDIPIMSVSASSLDIGGNVNGPSTISLRTTNAGGGLVSFFNCNVRLQTVTPATFAVSQNNFSVANGAIHRLAATAGALNVTGFDAGGNLDGNLICISNVGANAFTITNNDAASAASKRVLTGTGAGVVVGVDQSVWLWYDDTTGKWRLFKNA